MSDAHAPMPAWAPLLLAVMLLAVNWTLPSPVAAGGSEAAMVDPLRPPNLRRQDAAAPRVDPSRWQLNSTLVSNERLVAIINGQVVAPGESVDGARVLDVERKAARLRVGEVTFTIRSTTPTVRTGGGS